MARKTQNHDKAEVLVSIEQFNRTRDSVIHALTTLQQNLTHVQEGLSILLRAYMNHSASLLAREDGAAIESLQLPASLIANANAAAEAAQNASTNAAQAVAATPGPGASTAEAGKKKRKREKKERDPNAPKRPLTAAFLFAQSARPIVKADLERELEPGTKLEPNAVNLEVTKRWNEMDEEDKEKWKQSYRDSMVQFNKDMEAYKAKTGVAVEHDEELEEEDEAGALDTDASEESDDEAGAAATKEPTPPAPTSKTPRPSKRQKTAANSAVNGANHVAIAPASARSPVPLPSGGKQSAAHTPILPPVSTDAPQTNKKDRKKKDKAAPQAIAPAPAAQAEAAPDEGKKKGKGRTTRNAEAETTETPAAEPKATKKRDRSKRKSEGAAA